MANKNKSKEKTTEEEVKSLRSELDALTFKNEQAEKIMSIQSGKERLKDSLSKNRERRVSSSNRVSGLGKLGGLATFKQKYKDY